MRYLTLLAASLVTTGLAIAQLPAGSIGVTGFSTTSFGVIDNGVGTAVPIGSFGGTGTSQSILWDPSNPTDFLVGGFGFVGRASMTGAATATWTPLTTGVNTACQMSWNWTGQVVVADAGTDQVRLLDLTTNTVTDLSVGAQPWGSSVNAGAFEFTTGDVIVGGNGGVFRLPMNQTVGVSIATGLGGFVSGIAFDLAAPGDIIATILTANRLVRISPAGLVTDIFPSGTLTAMNSIEQDVNLDWIIGVAGANVYRVPYLGGAPVLLGGVTGVGTSASGVSIVRSGAGSATPYGTACNDAFGPVALGASGPLGLGATVTLSSTNHAANQLGFVIFGFSDTVHLGLPLPFSLDSTLGTVGCALLASIDASSIAFTGPAGPATLATPFTLPSFATGLSIYVQHACLAPVPGGMSWSNGLRLQLQ
jgi:hypothetical protein